jgi:hypothetical protein
LKSSGKQLTLAVELLLLPTAHPALAVDHTTSSLRASKAVSALSATGSLNTNAVTTAPVFPSGKYLNNFRTAAATRASA